jgi:Ca2+-binding EF-hand superfamily protein
MSTISGVSGSSTWSTIQSMRQKMAEDLFSKLDTSSKGYIDKATLQSALDSASSSTSSVDALFSKLDTNGDGKVTKQEFTDTLKQIESQLQANANLQAGGMPPPPPPANDAGFTKDELTAQLSEIGSSDSKRSSLISKVIANFDKADTNGDGKVSMQEAMALEQSSSNTASTSSSNSTASASDTTSTDTTAKILQQIMLLMQAYNSDSKSNSSTLSLLA